MIRSLLLCGAALCLAAAPARAAPPPGIDSRIEALLQTYGTPGLAVTIVESGQTTLARGYGVRRLGAPERNDQDTIFFTGSTGKALTVAALATLVDAGKLGWDDKVTDHLPGFQMYDPWVTREMTVRDLLVHRSGLGLGEGDLMFLPSTNRTRAEAVHSLRYLKPATSFRSGYAYDNVLYMAAGQMIEAITGQTFEDYVRDHVLKPAGMLHSTSTYADRLRNPNRAQPHGRLDGAIRGLGDQEVLPERGPVPDIAAPAGGLAISASDMSRWLKIQLAHGALPEGGRLFSEADSKEMWTPQVLQPIAPRPPALMADAPQFLSYALGWEVRDWRGHKIVWHAGADIGFGAVVVLIPEKNVGFSILMNAEDGVPTIGLMYDLLDYYLGYPAADWPSKLAAYKKVQIDAALAALKEIQVPAGSAAEPPLALARYTGDFKDPWYGGMSVTKGEHGLEMTFLQSPGMSGPLVHVQHDTFKVQWTDKQIEPAFVTFVIGAEGRVESVKMKTVSPLADFSYDYQDLDFRPVPLSP